MPKLKGKYAKQELFCNEYIVDFNGTQAAIRAGYSKKTAEAQASRLLTTVKVKARVAELMKKRNERMKMDADYVLTRLRQIDELDIKDIMEDDMKAFKSLSDWPKEWRISISGVDLMVLSNSKGSDISAIIKKIKWPDKTKNLELIGKHVNVSAFSENLSIINPSDVTPWSSITAGVDEMTDDDKFEE